MRSEALLITINNLNFYIYTDNMTDETIYSLKNMVWWNILDLILCINIWNAPFIIIQCYARNHTIASHFSQQIKYTHSLVST